MYFDFFPQERIELNKEVLYHPELVLRLKEVAANAPFEDKLLVIATYCNILVDGDYTQQDLNRVADACTLRLKQRRTEIILPIHGKEL